MFESTNARSLFALLREAIVLDADDFVHPRGERSDFCSDAMRCCNVSYFMKSYTASFFRKRYNNSNVFDIFDFLAKYYYV